MKKKTIVIRGYHCDSYGHVNNARYLELLEEARWEGLASTLNSKSFISRDLLFVVVNVNINYRAEVKPNDTIEIETTLKDFGKTSIAFFQEIFNQKSNKTAVDALVKFVLIKKSTGKMVTLDQELKSLFLNL